jgi:hypothetical protein
MELEKLVLNFPLYTIAAFSSAIYVGSLHSQGINPSHEDALLFGFTAASAPLTGIITVAKQLSTIWQFNNLKRHYRQEDIIVPYRTSTGDLVESRLRDVPKNRRKLVDETIETVLGNLLIKINEPKHYKQRMARSFAITSVASILGYSVGRAYGHFF